MRLITFKNNGPEMDLKSYYDTFNNREDKEEIVIVKYSKEYRDTKINKIDIKKKNRTNKDITLKEQLFNV